MLNTSIKTLIILLISLLISSFCFSQSEVISELHVQVGVVGVDILDPTLMVDESNNASQIVVSGLVVPTTELHKVHYKIGSVLEGNDVSHGYVTIGDLSSENAAGFIYIDNEIKIVLTPLIQSEHLYLELYTEDYSGNTSALSRAEYHQ